ncbi:MAG: hypothetical protein JW900_08545 [Anaerolineae bacterium]|nr:hypothetical protein [Anaerolineae bacterium]
MRIDEWVNETGLQPVAIPVLEVARAMGFVAAHLALFAQPLLAGWVSDSVFDKMSLWIQDPQQAEELLKDLEARIEEE